MPAFGIIALAAASIAQAVPVEPATAGKIIMYRGSSVMGAAIGCPIRYKGQEIVELGRGKFAEWVVPSGRYILTNKNSSVEVSVDPGETRYVRCSMKAGMMTARADMQIVDEESYMEHAKNYEQKPVADVLTRRMTSTPPAQP